MLELDPLEVELERRPGEGSHDHRANHQHQENRVVISQTDAERCLRCHAPLAENQTGCPVCGYALLGVQLYDPRRFAILGAILTPVVPLYLAATNWGRMGRPRLKWLWLGFGLAGFLLIAVVLVLASPAWSTPQRVLAIGLGLGAGYGLARMQQSDYGSAIRLGARPGSLVIGSAIGVGILCVALVVSIVLGVWARVMIDDSRFLYASNLAGQGKYEQAIGIFDDLLRRDPEFDEALFTRSICYGALDRWDEAGVGLDRFLSRHPRDAGALGLLASCRMQQGRRAEAESLAAVARDVDPLVFTRLGIAFDSLAADPEGLARP